MENDLYKELERIITREIVPSIKNKVVSTAMKTGLLLRDTVVDDVLKGPRSGIEYTFYDENGVKKKYRASAPGEAPARRTGNLARSFKFRNERQIGHNTATVISQTYSDVTDVKDGGNYAWIDQGIGKIAPRPYARKTLEKTVPMLEKLYSRIIQ